MRRTPAMRLMVLACAAAGLAAIAGCEASDNLTFLDAVQTVLLGISAAGAILLFRNT